MVNFKLNIKIPQKDLTTLIKAGESIVLVKGEPGKTSVIVWAVIRPAQNSSVSWSDEYYIYASNSDYEIGNTIIASATSSARVMSKYVYSEGSFSNPVTDNNLNPGQFMITNKVPVSTSGSIIFGLAETCKVNNELQNSPSPTRATIVPAMQYTILNASEKVTIFLSSQVSPGQVIPAPRTESADTRATSFAIIIDFSEENADQVINYDSSRGSFVLAN